MTRKAETLMLSRFNQGSEWVDERAEEPGLEWSAFVEDIADQFRSGMLEPDTFELIEVEVKRRVVIRAALQVTVLGDK